MRPCSTEKHIPLLQKGESKTLVSFFSATPTLVAAIDSVDTGQNEAENTGQLVYTEYNYLIVKLRVEIMDCSLICKETYASCEQFVANWIGLK